MLESGKVDAVVCVQSDENDRCEEGQDVMVYAHPYACAYAQFLQLLMSVTKSVTYKYVSETVLPLAAPRFKPKPVVARTVADIMASRGVKPVLSPNLDVLATVEALGVKKLLFIGVGCQV